MVEDSLCLTATLPSWVLAALKLRSPMMSPTDAEALSYCQAQPRDLAAVVTLMGELVAELDPTPTQTRILRLLPDDMDQALHSAQVCIYLAWHEHQAVGLCRADVLDGDPIFRLREDNRCGYIDQMYVRPAYRSQQVGQRLLHHCEAWVLSLGITQVLLHAAPKAVRFYARSGYQPNREMIKTLQP